MEPNLAPKSPSAYKENELFWGSFSGLVFSGCQGLPKDPKCMILAPKMGPQSSQNEPPQLQKKRPRDHRRHRKCNTNDRCLKAECETCRVIPKKIYVKKVLRRCSAQRAQCSPIVPSDFQNNPKGEKLDITLRKRQLRVKNCKTLSRETPNASSRLRLYGLVGSRRGVSEYNAFD